MADRIKVFVSVGRTRNDAQKSFVDAIETRMKAEGLEPCTVGRNYYTNDAPLVAVRELMEKCHGAVVIALERLSFEHGIELRDHPESKELRDVKLPTVWNQTEAAMAYTHRLPTFLIGENGLRSEGFLEKGYDWQVHWMDVSPVELNSAEFSGAFTHWRRKVLQNSEIGKSEPPSSELGDKGEIRPVDSTPPTKRGLLAGVVSAIAVLVATVGMLVLAANYAAQQFREILFAIVPLMILALAFISRASGLIGAGQMVELFGIARKKHKSGAKKPEAQQD